jgi:hypothetical protein
MSGPVIWVSHSTVKPGKLDHYRRHLQAATELVESEEPRMIALHSYASETGSDISTIQIHPDAESLDTHLKLFTEKLQELAFESLDTQEISVYGEPGEGARALLAEMPKFMPGIRIRVLPVHDAGFLRPQPL